MSLIKLSFLTKIFDTDEEAMEYLKKQEEMVNSKYECTLLYKIHDGALVYVMVPLRWEEIARSQDRKTPGRYYA